MSRFGEQLRKKQESGQAILLIAMATIALSAVLGLAIDGGGLFFLHRDSQNAVDAALVASLYAMCTGNRSDANYNQHIIDAGIAAARVNGFQTGSNGAVVTVDPTYQPPGTTRDYYVRVSILATKPSYFIQLVYREPLTVFTAGAGYCEPTRTDLLPEAAIISLKDVPGCDGINASFRLTGNGTLRVENSGIWVNSNDPDCALRFANPKQHLWVDEECSVIGGIEGVIETDADDPGGEVTDENYCQSVWQPAAADRAANQIDTHPLRHLAPPDDACAEPITTIDVKGNNSPLTIGPGRYAIKVSNNGVLRLEPGIYCMEEFDYTGGVITSTWDDDNDGDEDEHGVVLYMPYENSMKANGQSSFSVTAPTEFTCDAGDTCDWLGLLIWADVNPANEDSMNGTLMLRGGTDTGWVGMIYAPRSLCDMAGGSGAVAVGQLVCYNVDYTGGGTMAIQYEQPQFLQIPPKVSIAE